MGDSFSRDLILAQGFPSGHCSPLKREPPRLPLLKRFGHLASSWLPSFRTRSLPPNQRRAQTQMANQRPPPSFLISSGMSTEQSPSKSHLSCSRDRPQSFFSQGLTLTGMGLRSDCLWLPSAVIEGVPPHQASGSHSFLWLLCWKCFQLFSRTQCNTLSSWLFSLCYRARGPSCPRTGCSGGEREGSLTTRVPFQPMTHTGQLSNTVDTLHRDGRRKSNSQHMGHDPSEDEHPFLRASRPSEKLFT